MEKKFLNIEELSQYLGIKKSNLYSKVERREIPCYKWGEWVVNEGECSHVLKRWQEQTLEE